VQHISDMHSKFAQRQHHVWKYGRHLISDRGGKKRRRRRRKIEITGQKYNGQGGHKKTKARFSRLLRHPAWKRRGPILISALHKSDTYLDRQTGQDRQDRQRSDSIGRTVLQTVAQKSRFWLAWIQGGGITGTCGRPVFWRFGKSGLSLVPRDWLVRASRK